MAGTSPYQLALIQHACPASASIEGNWATTERLLREAADHGADLAVTQELFVYPYFPQTEDQSHFDLAEPIPGPTTNRLCVLADELDMAINASLFERRTAGVYHNTAVMIDSSGRLVGRYRKMHIPDDPHFYEKFYFTPGDAGEGGDGDGQGFGVQRLDGLTTGMLICWDQWFPEAARLATLQGAQVLTYPTAIGWHHEETANEAARQKDAWQTIHRAHAIANGLYVAAVNRVGVEGDLRFWGGSFVVDPGGQIIAEASQNDEQVLLARIDLNSIETTRRAWPFLRDRRVDAYPSLAKRYLDSPDTTG